MMPRDLRGYVLAGGESSRMRGHGLPADKAAFIWNGQSLLARASTLLQSVCEAHGILCGTEERCTRLLPEGGGIVDRFLGMGPLGGFEAALADAQRRGASWILVVPVDLPFLASDLLSAFISHALTVGASVCCLREADVTQPLPTLVRVDTLPLVQQCLMAGGRRLLFELSSVARLTTPEQGLVTTETSGLRNVRFDHRWFWNVNTPADFCLMQQRETSEIGLHQSTHGE